MKSVEQLHPPWQTHYLKNMAPENRAVQNTNEILSHQTYAAKNATTAALSKLIFLGKVTALPLLMR